MFLIYLIFILKNNLEQNKDKRGVRVQKNLKITGSVFMSSHSFYDFDQVQPLCDAYCS